MKNLPNIEKSGFHAGEYVGYARGTVWRIRRDGKCWRALARDKCVPGYINRKTLAELSAALAAWDSAERAQS